MLNAVTHPINEENFDNLPDIIELTVKPEFHNLKHFEKWCKAQIPYNLAWESACTNESKVTIIERLEAFIEEYCNFIKDFKYNIDLKKWKKQALCEVYLDAQTIIYTLIHLKDFLEHKNKHCFNQIEFNKFLRSLQNLPLSDQDIHVLNTIKNTFCEEFYAVLLHQHTSLRSRFFQNIQTKLPSHVFEPFVNIVNIVYDIFVKN